MLECLSNVSLAKMEKLLLHLTYVVLGEFLVLFKNRFIVCLLLQSWAVYHFDQLINFYIWSKFTRPLTKCKVVMTDFDILP